MIDWVSVLRPPGRSIVRQTAVQPAASAHLPHRRRLSGPRELRDSRGCAGENSRGPERFAQQRLHGPRPALP